MSATTQKMSTTTIPFANCEWSPPGSDNAKQFGHPKGCWTASVTYWASAKRETLITKAVAGFASEAKARDAVARINETTKPTNQP